MVFLKGREQGCARLIVDHHCTVRELSVAERRVRSRSKPETQMFRAEIILIVEDEPIIAMDLADAVSELGGGVVGPFATVWEAFASLEHNAISGAILDATLQDRDITPLAAHLIGRDIPIVIHSGTGLPKELAALHPDLAVIAKPATSSWVTSRLARGMGLAQPARIDAPK